jgi:hypothetical protein
MLSFDNQQSIRANIVLQCLSIEKERKESWRNSLTKEMEDLDFLYKEILANTPNPEKLDRLLEESPYKEKKQEITEKYQSQCGADTYKLDTWKKNNLTIYEALLLDDLDDDKNEFQDFINKGNNSFLDFRARKFIDAHKGKSIAEIENIITKEINLIQPYARDRVRGVFNYRSLDKAVANLVMMAYAKHWKKSLIGILYSSKY